MGNQSVRYQQSKAHDLSSNFNEEVIGEDAHVIEVHLHSCSRLKRADLGAASDPYVLLQLQGGKSKQTRYSSYQPSTLDPKWDPAEVFRFLVNDKPNTKLLIQVMDRDLLSADDMLGDCAIDLSSLETNSTHVEERQLVDPATGKEEAGSISFTLHCLDVEKGTAEVEDVIYEYQRWIVTKGWGAEGFFLPGDPGKFTNEDLSIRGDKMEDCVVPIKEGYKEIKPWGIIPSAHDPEGWHYATHPRAQVWSADKGPMRFVRRRTHRRITIDPNILKDHEARV